MKIKHLRYCLPLEIEGDGVTKPSDIGAHSGSNPGSVHGRACRVTLREPPGEPPGHIAATKPVSLDGTFDCVLMTLSYTESKHYFNSCVLASLRPATYSTPPASLHFSYY